MQVTVNTEIVRRQCLNIEISYMLKPNENGQGNSNKIIQFHTNQSIQPILSKTKQSL